MAGRLSALALSLFFIMPLPTGLFEDDSLRGENIINSELFFSRSWAEWNDLDVHPLRELGGGKVLVWGALEGDVEPARTTEYRGSGGEVGPFLVVMEPFLPEGVAERLFSEIDRFGFNPEWVVKHRGLSPSPNVIAIQPPEIFGDWWPAIEQMHGLHWVEPVLKTEGRNDVSASIMQHGLNESWPAWLLGLDGSGVVIANADSGIDRDHACFREATDAGAPGSEWNNATGTPGINHRKILFLNESIDDWDSPSNENYRHGTHIAGSLACRSVWEIDAENNGRWSEAVPRGGASMAHGAKLVIEDVVDGDGWHIPAIESLFSEAAEHGAVIRSDSWGDDSSEYTHRTSMFDTWLYQVPWSVSFVAPGNTGAEVLEPANGLNVVSVGAAHNDGSADIWTLSPRNETQQGRMGVTIVAPGVKISSAKADGIHDSYNDDMRTSTGTSMSTPQAAAAAAVIQQMVENGWITDNRSGNGVPTTSLRPDWAAASEPNLRNGSIMLAEGFTPSGPLIRALLTLSGESLEGGRQAELSLGPAPDNSQGWGRINLSNLVDFRRIEEGLSDGDDALVEPSGDLWVHDSFRLHDNGWQELVATWIDEDSSSISTHEWDGGGAVGPFLSTQEEVSWTVTPQPNSDFNVRLAWNSAPNIDARDDLDLLVVLNDGRVYFGNDFTESGVNDSIETIEGVHIPSSSLAGITSMQVIVVARHVHSGPNEGVVGLMGDKIGFALAIKGINREVVVSNQGWDEISIDNDKNTVQWGDFMGVTAPIVAAVIVLFIVGIVIIDWKVLKHQHDGGGAMTEGQPSNHEGFSLPTAIVPRTGDDDE